MASTKQIGMSGTGGFGRGLMGRVGAAVVSCAAVIGFVAGTTVPATPADAQMRMGMGGGGMGMGGTSVSRQSLETYARILNLDEAQKEAAKLLADGFRGTLADLEKDLEGRVRKLQDEAQDEGWGVFQKEMPKMVTEFGERQQKAEAQFIEDIKMILTPEQLEQFPKVEHHRRRETFLRMGMVSGAGVDVWSIQDRLMHRAGDGAAVVAEENKAQLAELMDRYDTDMDRLLQEMERKYKEDMRKYAEGTEDMFDFSKMEERLKPYNELGIRIRDLNRDSARKIEALLTEEGQKAFREQFNMRAYPRVYRKSVAQKLYDAAAKLPDLTAEQKDAMGVSKAQYERDATPANEAWARAIDEAESKSGGSIGLMMSGFGGGSDPALAEARKARREADKAAQDRLMDLLTADQKKQLPSEDSLREDPMQAMFGGGGGDEEEE
jgi:Spy/CpxP family protein refolding chaperone